MKTILIDDWYAPEFRVKITPPRSCPLPIKRPRIAVAPIFRTTHAGLWKTNAFREIRRRSRFGLLRTT